MRAYNYVLQGKLTGSSGHYKHEDIGFYTNLFLCYNNLTKDRLVEGF